MLKFIAKKIRKITHPKIENPPPSFKYNPYPLPQPTVDLSPNTSEKKFELTQRFPNFMTGFSSEVYHFNTAEELKEAQFVQHWIDKGGKLAKSRTNKKQAILMIDLPDNSFWAIGFIKSLKDQGFDDLDLPEHRKNNEQK
jgi:hypothetical protein